MAVGEFCVIVSASSCAACRHVPSATVRSCQAGTTTSESSTQIGRANSRHVSAVASTTSTQDSGLFSQLLHRIHMVRLPDPLAQLMAHDVARDAIQPRARHGVATDNFEQAVLTRCLYPQARVLRNLLVLTDAEYFEPDLELIRATGQLTRASGFAAEVSEYNYHAGNSGRLRREWKLRLSVTRLRALVLDTLGADAPEKLCKTR